jgi:hypothetical protein
MVTRPGLIAMLPFVLSELAQAAEGRLEITDVLSSVSYSKSAPEPGGLTTHFEKGMRGHGRSFLAGGSQRGPFWLEWGPVRRGLISGAN